MVASLLSLYTIIQYPTFKICCLVEDNIILEKKNSNIVCVLRSSQALP